MEFLETLNAAVWGIPTLVLIIGVGLYISIRTRFVQFRLFPKALKAFCGQLMGKTDSNGVSSYQALCTALAATVGTGNLAGVAGAIAIGGPGAIFWMWVCGFLGMATKFAEAVLAIRYRIKNDSGEFVGGPMYMICNGLSKNAHWLAGVYCFFCVVASFGVGNATQINTVISGINSALTAVGGKSSFFGNLVMGAGLGVLIAVMLLGGAKRIGTAAEALVPFASVAYLLLGVFVLIAKADAILYALRAIVVGAFSPGSVTGGMLGSSFIALRIGASRGVFTNEAGMGTASIAHASASVKHPVDQGMMGIMEVFLDTIVICTMTALVILCSGIEIRYGTDTGIALTSNAFSEVLGDWTTIPIALALCCFAIATVLGWGLYGIRCAQYLFGDNAWRGFAILQGVMVFVGAIMNTQTVWVLAECVNGLMAIPNLIALALLTPQLRKITIGYKKSPTNVGPRIVKRGIDDSYRLTE